MRQNNRFLSRLAYPACCCITAALLLMACHDDDNPDTSFRDLFLYCAQHTLGSHARIVNAANFGNLYITGPAEFIRYNK